MTFGDGSHEGNHGQHAERHREGGAAVRGLSEVQSLMTEGRATAAWQIPSSPHGVAMLRYVSLLIRALPSSDGQFLGLCVDKEVCSHPEHRASDKGIGGYFQCGWLPCVSVFGLRAAYEEVVQHLVCGHGNTAFS